MGVGKETSEGVGLPNEQNAQSASAEGSTSKVGDVVEISPKGKEKFKFNNQELSAKDIAQLINRGVGYQQVQSENDKLKNQLAELAEQKAFLDRYIAEQEQDKKIENSVSKILGSQMKKKVELDEYGDPIEPETEPETPIDINAYLQSLRGDIINQFQPQVAQMTEKTIREIIEREMLQRKQQEDDSAYFSTQEKSITDQYAVRYNDLLQLKPQAMNEIKKVIGLQARNLALDVQMPQLFSSDKVKFRELNEEKIDNTNEILSILSRLDIDNERATKELEASAVLTQGFNPMVIADDKPKKKPKTQKEMAEYKESREKESEKKYQAWKMRQGLS